MLVCGICYALPSLWGLPIQRRRENTTGTSSDAIPIRRLPIFSQGFRCQKTSESRNIQATVTRQLHTSHVLRSIERIDSITSNDSRSLEATDSLSNAVCFEWPATTRFRARYRDSADDLNPTGGKRKKLFLLSALLCAFRLSRLLGRDKGNQTFFKSHPLQFNTSCHRSVRCRRAHRVHTFQNLGSRGQHQKRSMNSDRCRCTATRYALFESSGRHRFEARSE